MTTPGAPYLDRADAGRRLAAEIGPRRFSRAIVLALPRGGVPIASVIAERLNAPLDILVVRKVGAPGNREYGLGAVAEGGVRYVDWDRVRELGLSPGQLDPEIRSQTEAVDQLARHLRGGRSPPDLEGRTVVLVDDGMATGGTVRCAVDAVRLQRPGRLVLAVGVSSREAAQELRPRVDDLVCPLIPPLLFAVGEWYREFPQLTDAEVLATLHRHWMHSTADVTAA
ncbi:MAG: phosphoribosyltransferase family protein [Thermoplasmata archaeon]|jgi:putative phosphoribosyl transferase